MNAATKTPTPAQRRWLMVIGGGTVTRCGHSWVNGMRNSGRQPGMRKSTYVMTLALRDAGWIAEGEAKPGGPFEDRYPLVLTDAGRAAIGA